MARRIHIRGRVQGVGFRPFVHQLAQALGLSGWVRNAGDGVQIHLEGVAEAFLQRLRAELPPAARIDALDVAELPELDTEGFRILESEEGESGVGEIAPDLALCPDCRVEVAGTGRRHGYPFTSCAHCGPRFTIIDSLPYDRPRTAMAPFALCPECASEYADPVDRRHHAQTIACPECGPRYWLEQGGQRADEDVIERAAELIRQGGIVAIKGIGGFHLACDAGNEAAVAELRRRKHRVRKPLALMARDLEQLRHYAGVGEEEARLLASAAAPVVLLPARGGLAGNIAPGMQSLGFMLPYTPLHQRLMDGLERPMVLTSANRSGEPQCIDNEEAQGELAGVADAWLMHERPILRRLDDSVLRVADGRPRIIRRARGYVPESLPLPEGFESAPSLLAMGGDLKNAFCLLGDGRAVLSAPQGDMQGVAVQRAQREALADYQALFGHQPVAVAVDGHPDYHATRIGREMGLPIIEVQHHHAHLAAVMIEHGLPLDGPPLLGICLDGIGLGSDGALWGGEFLGVDYRSCERLAHFDAVPLPGGEQAMREPWRNLVAHLNQALGWRGVEVCCGDRQGLDFIRLMLERGINSPPASSAGRLFDAVAALLGQAPERQDFEGEAAMALEALAAPYMGDERIFDYGCDMDVDGVIRWRLLWRGLINDTVAGLELGLCAARFHHTLIATLTRAAHSLSEEGDTILLSGGVMQNRILLEGLSRALRDSGRQVLSPSAYPANDGGLALGQAVVAVAIMQGKQSPAQ